MFSRKAFFIYFLIFFTPVQSAFAKGNGGWGEYYASELFGQIYTDFRIIYRGAVTGIFKQAVGQVMNTQISVLIGGGGDNGPLFIVNWQTFLVSDPQKKANTYINDFFSQTLRGRNTSNYRPRESGAKTVSFLQNEGIVKSASADTNVSAQALYDTNYYKYLAQSAIDTINPQAISVNLMSYASSPSQIFNQGNWKGFNSFFGNPANNPFGYSFLAQSAYRNKLSQEQDKAQTMAIAYQGFKASVAEDGTVKTPGITIGQLVDKVQGFSFDSITTAQDFATLISSGVASAASMAITTAVQTGLNAATDALSEVASGDLNLSLDASFADTEWNDQNGFDTNNKQTGTLSSSYTSGGIPGTSDPKLSGPGGPPMDSETADCIKRAGNSDKYTCTLKGKSVVVVNRHAAGENWFPGCVGKSPTVDANSCRNSGSIKDEIYAIRFPFGGISKDTKMDMTYPVDIDTRDAMTFSPIETRYFRIAVSTIPGDFTNGVPTGCINPENKAQSVLNIADQWQKNALIAAGKFRESPLISPTCFLQPGQMYYINLKPKNPGCIADDGTPPNPETGCRQRVWERVIMEPFVPAKPAESEAEMCIKNSANSDKYTCTLKGKSVVVVNPNFAGETYLSGCAGKPNASKSECSTSSSIGNESYAIRLKFQNGLDPAVYGDTAYRILYDTRDTMYDFEKYRSFQMTVSDKPGYFANTKSNCSALDGAPGGNVDIIDERQSASKNPFACRLKAGSTYYVNIRPTYPSCKQDPNDTAKVMCSVFVRDLVPGSGKPAK